MISIQIQLLLKLNELWTQYKEEYYTIQIQLLLKLNGVTKIKGIEGHNSNTTLVKVKL